MTVFVGKVVRRIVRGLRIGYYRLISDNVAQRHQVDINQPVLCAGRGTIVLDGCHLGVQPSPYFWSGYTHIEAREPAASIHIGPDVWINNSAVLIAERTSIRIDRGCLLGPDVKIFDSDFHTLDPAQRMSGKHQCFPVHLEENVFVGASATILKGVRIGRNSVVAAGALVTLDVPGDSIAAGVPARVVGRVCSAE